MIWLDILSPKVLHLLQVRRNSLTIDLLAKAVYKKDDTDTALIPSISMRYYAGNRCRDGDMKIIHADEP